MSRIIFNDYLDAALAALAVGIVLVMIAYGVIRIRQARATPQNTAIEIGGAAVGHG
jgi:carbon starvation protein